jgi:hypothetical protein
MWERYCAAGPKGPIDLSDIDLSGT